MTSFQASFQRLNQAQKKAVTTTSGRVLILAGAGCGKTSVLTHRIAHLIENNSIHPEAILGLTFTNKAAGEMRSRLASLIPSKKASAVFLSTFHSFCMNVLKDHIEKLGYAKNFSLYSEREVNRVMQHIARAILDHDSELPSLAPTQALIAKAKNKGETIDTLLEKESKWHQSFAKQMYERLEASLRAFNALDFDTLLSLTLELFTKFPDITQQYQQKYQYILIDEYQDTNPVQFKIAQKLSESHRNLCVVGDDDQSIYGWRGADVRNILNFGPDHLIKLEQNYRSSPHILLAANAMIKNNVSRHEKVLWTSSEEQEQIALFHAPSELDEANSIIERMLYLKESKKLAWSDMAILYRSNILSRTMEIALMQAPWQKDGKWIRGIPYEIFGGTEFNERSEIRDILAFLKVLCNPKDEEALLRIINVPRRGLSDFQLDKITACNRSLQIPLWEVLLAIAEKDAYAELELTKQAKGAIKNFVQLMQEGAQGFHTLPLPEALKLFIEKINYKKAIEEEVKSEKMREFKWENILLCSQLMENFLQEKPSASLHDFITASLLEDDAHKRKKSSEKSDSVSLMTFHSAKGLEFSACFLMGIEDHIIPHEKSLLETGLEEERRLFYVALTRAKKHLTISMARNRKRMGKDQKSEPSRFLFEIPNNLIKIISWQTASY